MHRLRPNSIIGRRYVQIRRFTSMQVAKKTCSTLGRRIGVVNKIEQVKRDELENHKLG